MELQNWINLHRLNAQITSLICVIQDKQYLILNRQEEDLLFNENFEFIFSEEEEYLISTNSIDSVLFEFGENWYRSQIEQVKLNPFRYIGLQETNLHLDFPYLGIHGEYELCNGSRPYNEWCKKAKFLNYKSLGICENNTLAGTLSFQMACKDVGIKSILGETITVSKDKEGKKTYQVKLYVKNEEGWINLLNINSQIKVFNQEFVTEEYLLNRTEGLICVFCLADIDIITPNHIINFQEKFKDDLYFQLDFSEFSSSDKDKKQLEAIQFYLSRYLKTIKPIIICDSFYLDKEQNHIKKILNKIGKVGFQFQSADQYFKSAEDIYLQIEELFEGEELPLDIFYEGCSSAIELDNKCNFSIKLGELYLPEYEMSESEKAQYKTNEDLFFDLIQQGFELKSGSFVKDEILEEFVHTKVIKKGGLVDYFLILADVIRWCKRNDVLTGVGRGSAAGSLVSYLLDLTKVDPLKYDLLFERFLNEGRLGKSLPDIDSDFPSDRIDYVTSIGTYGTFKVKSGIKDLARALNADMKSTNYITGILDDDLNFTEIFKTKNKNWNIYVQKNARIIENYPLIANQVKTSSVHAAGVIIVPKVHNGRPMTIYDWIPVKKIDGVLVTEWEGPQLESAGYLKEDILGIMQLQKLSEICKLIKLHHNKTIEFSEIPVDDENVFYLFQQGYNEDVFQFGTIGLKGYCRELKPTSIEDLIAAVSLYRPGPMESGAHKDYIKIKNGLKEPEYDYMLKGVTLETHSMYIYQEQAMRVVQILGGFDLVTADDVRKAMGKKDLEKMTKYKTQFINGAIKNGCDEYKAIVIWNKLEAFAGYGFNKSHAAVYAYTGYYCQFLKHHYPLEFWATALGHSKQEDITKRIAEMHKISEVRVLPPDINKSSNTFEVDIDTQEIYWAINSISQIGEVTLSFLLKERETNGLFYSFEDFILRMKGGPVNSRSVTNLILAGCFDKIEKIKKPSDRLLLMKKYFSIINKSVPELYLDTNHNWKDYFWVLEQKNITGFGYLDFEKIYNNYLYDKLNNSSKIIFVEASLIQEESSLSKQKQYGEEDDRCLVGILSEVIERKINQGKKKGQFFAEIKLEANDEFQIAIIWTEKWIDLKDKIMQSKNKIVCITGKIEYDGKYRMINNLYTTSKTQVEVL